MRPEAAVDATAGFGVKKLEIRWSSALLANLRVLDLVLSEVLSRERLLGDVDPSEVSSCMSRDSSASFKSVSSWPELVSS